MSESTQQVKDFFDDYASKFSSIYHEEQKNPITRMLDKTWRRSMFDRFKRVASIIKEQDSKSVLDIGCGPGWHDVLIAKSQDVHITGVDIAPNMIQIAESQAKEHGVSEQCDFTVANVLEHSFDGTTFDVVFAVGVVEYFEKPEEILKIMHDLANKVAVFSIPVESHWLTPQRKIRYKLRNCPLWFYNESKINDLMSRIGVEKFTIERHSRDYLVLMQH